MSGGNAALALETDAPVAEAPKARDKPLTSAELLANAAKLNARGAATQSAEDQAILQAAFDAVKKAQGAIDRQAARDAAEAERVRSEAVADLTAQHEQAVGKGDGARKRIDAGIARALHLEAQLHEVYVEFKAAGQEGAEADRLAAGLRDQIAALGGSSPAKPAATMDMNRITWTLGGAVHQAARAASRDSFAASMLTRRHG